MERGEKEVPLVNGGREAGGAKAEEAAAAAAPATPERQPCLPAGEAERRRRPSAADSVAKRRGGGEGERGGRLGARVEARLRRRTGLSRAGLTASAVVLALLLLFLVVIVVLACTWPQTPHAHLFPVCTRAACLQASAQILPKMDTSAVPCDDFWGYACGGWLRESSPPRAHWSLAEAQALQYRERLRTLVTTLSFPMDPTTKEWKLQYLYESCMRLDNIEADGTRQLVKLIMELGGWFVLSNFHPGAWDHKHTFVKLFTTQRITPFFHVDVVPDPHNATKSIVKIMPADLDLPDKSYYYRDPDSAFVPPSGEFWSVHIGQVCVDLSNITSLQSLFKRLNDMNVPSSFKQYLKDIATSFGARTIDARKFSAEVFHYEKRLAEAMPDREELDDPVASSHRDTVGSLGLRASSIPLLDILQVMFPKAAITNDTEVLVPSSLYLSTISRILSSSDRISLNEYMMWVFAASYVPYLNSEVREIESAYKGVLTGTQKPTERWEMCISTLEKYMGLALASLVEHSTDKTERDATNTQVKQIFDYVRDVVRTSITNAYWFDKDLQEIALQKVDTMTLQVGVSSPKINEDYLKKFYEGLHIQRSDFFINIRNAKEFQVTYLNKKLMDPQEEYMWLEAASIGKKVSYIPTANKIVIPQWLLSAPFYHPQYPLSVQYGGMGVQLAYAMVEGIMPQNILYNAKGMLLSENRTVVNQSAASVRQAKAFIIRDLVQNNIASQTIANQTALTTVIHIAALRQAHKALSQALVNLPHMHQPAMETYESEQLFFLTNAQNLCFKSSPQQMDIDVTTSQHLNGSQLLPAVLRQLREFSQAFSCPSTSVHYSSNIIPDIL